MLKLLCWLSLLCCCLVAVAEGASSHCQNAWLYPEGCQPPNCTYIVTWRYKQPEDAIEFVIRTSQPDRWTGIIFSKEKNISDSDGIFAWVEEHSYVMMDAHLPDFSQALSDRHQSVSNISASLIGGVATFNFTRKRDTHDPEDISFADDAPCPYLIFPVDGGSINYENRTIVPNEYFPYISNTSVCIRACESSKPNSPYPSPSRSTTRRPALTSSPRSQPAATPTTRTPTTSSITSSTTSTTTTTTTTPPPPTTTTSKRPTTTTTTSTTTTTTQTPSTTKRPPTTTTTTTTSTTTPAPPSTTTSTTTTTTTVPPTTTKPTATVKPPATVTTQSTTTTSAPTITTAASSQSEQWCAGRWSHPANCNFRSPAPADVVAYLQTPVDANYNIRPLPIELSDCDYFAQWQYIEQGDSIEFIIQTKTRHRWTGIGFSNTSKMANSDAIIGLIEEHSGRHFIMDTWLRDQVMPEIDKQQDITQTYGKRENGTTTVRFRRSRLTNDPFDFQFTDTSCAYFMFPSQGGPFNAISKRLHKHVAIPSVSEQKICVRKCKASTLRAPVTTTPSSTTTTTTTTSTSTPISSSTTSQANSFPSFFNSFGSSSTTSTTSTSTTTAVPALNSSGLPPLSSNDLEADIDGDLGTSTVVQGQASTPTASHSNPFSGLAFLSEPSLRWLAGIGCVATLLAMIVFQACFTIYKNKQAYKQDLYRQRAFKQNTYLHSAYLSQHDANGSVANGSAGVGQRNYSSSGAGSTNTQSSNTATAITSAAATATPVNSHRPHPHHQQQQQRAMHNTTTTSGHHHVVSRARVVAGSALVDGHGRPIDRHAMAHRNELARRHGIDDEHEIIDDDDDGEEEELEEEEEDENELDLVDEDEEEEEEEEFDDMMGDYDDDMIMDDAFNFNGDAHQHAAGRHYMQPNLGHPHGHNHNLHRPHPHHHHHHNHQSLHPGVPPNARHHHHYHHSHHSPAGHTPHHQHHPSMQHRTPHQHHPPLQHHPAANSHYARANLLGGNGGSHHSHTSFSRQGALEARAPQFARRGAPSIQGRIPR